MVCLSHQYVAGEAATLALWRASAAGLASSSQRTTIRALRDGGLDAADAIGLVAGLADISIPGSGQGNGSNDWAAGFFVIPSLGCDRLIVNDAVVAHRGALLGQLPRDSLPS
jgi:glucosamine kinase